MDLRLEALRRSTDGRSLVRGPVAGGPERPGRRAGRPNGSGKSTALRCVYRALRPTSGTVRLGGDDLDDAHPAPERAGRRRHGPGGRPDLDFTVAEVVALGRTPHLRGNRPLSSREEDAVRAGDGTASTSATSPSAACSRCPAANASASCSPARSSRSRRPGARRADQPPRRPPPDRAAFTAARPRAHRPGRPARPQPRRRLLRPARRALAGAARGGPARPRTCSRPSWYARCSGWRRA